MLLTGFMFPKCPSRNQSSAIEGTDRKYNCVTHGRQCLSQSRKEGEKHPPERDRSVGWTGSVWQVTQESGLLCNKTTCLGANFKLNKLNKKQIVWMSFKLFFYRKHNTCKHRVVHSNRCKTHIVKNESPTPVLPGTRTYFLHFRNTHCRVTWIWVHPFLLIQLE